MGGILVIGELAPDGSLTKLSTEVATLARDLADAAGTNVRGCRRRRLARGCRCRGSLPSTCRVVVTVDGFAPDRSLAPVAAALAGLAADADVLLCSASPDGRDAAGTLSALTGLGRPRERDRRPLVRGRSRRRDERVRRQAHHRERLHRGPGHHHGPSQQRDGHEAGARRARSRRPRRPRPRSCPEVRVVDRVEEGAAAVSIDDARIIVAGGRGVGGPEGFGLDRATSPRRSVAPSGRPEPRSTPAGSRTASRSARPARSSSRSSTSRSASAARSSTRSACRRQGRSSRSTGTPTPRSPSSLTCSSSATCSRSARRSWRRLRARSG